MIVIFASFNNYINKNMDYEVLYFLKMVFAFGFTYFTYYKTKSIIQNTRTILNNNKFTIEEIITTPPS